jgi:hypothetical protein
LLEKLNGHLMGTAARNQHGDRVSRLTEEVDIAPDQGECKASGTPSSNDGSEVIYVREDSRQYLTPDFDTDGIPFKEDETPWGRAVNGEAEYYGIPLKIFGTPEEIEAIINLCRKYPEIFSTEVQPEPAIIPPMELDVDVEKWRNLKCNSGGPRPVGRSKQEETQKQTSKMSELKVIITSMADRYSQVLLVPKPGGKWRFCIDYVKLNECTRTKEAWPLPNIPQMIDRIGRTQPKFFGKMDLTSGYHQAPLSPFAQLFTAFITWCGVFHWLRVPMGLKGAPSYFQRVIASVVLSRIDVHR